MKREGGFADESKEAALFIGRGELQSLFGKSGNFLFFRGVNAATRPGQFTHSLATRQDFPRTYTK